jgi:Mg2+ and Co2+ transporter CorA
VTVIFLPLSFFTGYYGMNLKGLFDSNKTEAYFWKVCGSTTLAIVLIVGLFAFRHQFKEKPLVWKEPETEKEV